MAECKCTQADQVLGKVESTASDEVTSPVCEPCRVDNNIQPAEGWCETCDEMLCNNCYAIHCRPTLMRNHQLKSITDMRNMKLRKRVSIKCDKHEGKPLEYFCKGHAELGCSQCFVTKHRLCRKVVCIADVKTNESTEFKTLESFLSEFETRLRANEEIIEDNLICADIRHEKNIANINEAGEKLKTKIDDLVKRQLLEAEKRNENIFKHLSSVEEIQKDIGKKLKSGKEMLAAEITDNTRLFVTMKSLQHEAHILKSMLNECVKKNKVEENEFELSPELEVVLDNVEHLGTLKDKQLLDMEKPTEEVVDFVNVSRFQQSHYIKLSFTQSTIRDAIRVTSDHDIRLLHVLLYARADVDTKVSLAISEGGNCLIRCNGAYKKEEDPQVVAVNVVKEDGADGITLQAGHQYDIDVTAEGGWYWHYYGRYRFSKVTNKGVTVKFSNTDRTNALRSSFVGLRLNII